MVADSITDSQLFHGSPISKDLVKKRKANWLWKLKQWKIDARRRQWKKANGGEEENGCSRLRSLPDKPTDIKTASARVSYLQAWSVVDHHELGSYGGFAKCDDDTDDDDETDLSAKSPTSVLKNKDSDSNKSGDDCFCCSQQITEEDEERFDDADEFFEDFSDALNSFENEINVNPFLQDEAAPIPDPNTRASAIQRNKSSPAKLIQKDKCKKETSPAKAIPHRVSSEKDEDKCEQQTSAEKAVQQKVSSKKTKKKKKNKKKSDQKKEGDDEISPSCPVCFDEMDATDLSFSPCRCGKRLCLFCHNLINEGNGRCPFCREKYDKTTSNSEEVSFQQRGRSPVRLSSSFGVLNDLD